MADSIGTYTFEDNELKNVQATLPYDVQETKKAAETSVVEHNGRFARTWDLSGFLKSNDTYTYLQKMAQIEAIGNAYQKAGFTSDKYVPDTGNSVQAYISSIYWGTPVSSNPDVVPFTIGLKEALD